ncbi:MAG TPA: hypothetical protein P5525_13670 [Candidatus Paceibacterota bacterium]|nr:hypothetical protein [Candidatus Paceibacterota bacterium]
MTQIEAGVRPQRVERAAGQRPAVRFSGSQSLHGPAFAATDYVLQPGANALAGRKGELSDLRLVIDVPRSRAGQVVVTIHGKPRHRRIGRI